MAPLPSFQFRSGSLPDDQAFEEWRTLMSSVFTVQPNPLVPYRPRGDLASYVLGDMMASRMTFNAQRMTRQKSLINATPDHLTFQLYHSGGFVGEIAGQAATLRRGLVVVSDMRYGIEANAMQSNTAGLSIPHRLLEGGDPRRPVPILEPGRNRLLAARIAALHRDLPSLDQGQAAAVAAELVSFVRRLFDRSSARDVLDGAELDVGLRALAERSIARNLGSSDLSPASVAENCGVSRATLYRAFAPEGVMDYVRRARLESVRDALSDPTERRSLARIAADHGFSSLSLLGRSYRKQFGQPPRDARAAAARRAADLAEASDFAVYDRWWRGLGAG